MKRSLTRICLLILTIAACTSPPLNSLENPTTITSATPSIVPIPGKSTMTNAPQAKDVNLAHGNIFLKEVGLLIHESMPPQIALDITGDLPTPCNLFRAKISLPDFENKIVVDVYTITDHNMMCIQVLEPFHENVELGTFPTGHYSVWVNGDLVGEFNS